MIIVVMVVQTCSANMPISNLESIDIVSRSNKDGVALTVIAASSNGLDVLLILNQWRKAFVL